MIPWLDNRLTFPDPRQALTDPDGLLAAGGDLSPERLREAYRRGIFPWYASGDPILWWSPDPRALLYLTDYRPSRSLQKLLRRHVFSVTLNKAFEQVIRACARTPRPGQRGTWIDDRIIDAYCQLHALGHAFSVETWDRQGKLAGGLYGVFNGRLFSGESMFHHQPNAAKVAFHALVCWLRQAGSQWLDGQIMNPFLSRLGFRPVARHHFLRLLDELPVHHLDKAPQTLLAR